MKKLVMIVLATLLVLTLGTATVLAGNDSQIPSAKAAFATADVYAVTAGKAQSDSGWFPVLMGQIKTGEPKDLVIDVSAETVLGTSAKLSGDQGSQVKAEILIQVLVDGQTCMPGAVTFDNRLLKLEGDLTHHYTEPGMNPVPLPIDDHWIEIFLDTKSAHSFIFCIENVGSGVHDIEVQARLVTDEKGLKGEADAAIGHISMAVDEVMLKAFK